MYLILITTNGRGVRPTHEREAHIVTEPIVPSSIEDRIAGTPLMLPLPRDRERINALVEFLRACGVWVCWCEHDGTYDPALAVPHTLGEADTVGDLRRMLAPITDGARLEEALRVGIIDGRVRLEEALIEHQGTAADLR